MSSGSHCGMIAHTNPTALLAYDWCISLSSEINLFWRAPRTSASLLYFFTRYCVLLEWAIALITIHPVSDMVRMQIIVT